MRLLAAMLLVVLVSACNSEPEVSARGRVIVVDPSGAPIRGAILVPEPENPSVVPIKYDRDEIAARASDAQGVLPALLDMCLWDSDGCYHFRVQRSGYEDAAMVVSRDLFPPVLRIVLKPVSSSSKPARRPGASSA
jgi:hypothetical protein